MPEETLYWYDYETFGEDPYRDLPVQFAGIRTDLDLNPISQPLVLYCKPPPDYLPSPVACLIHGITPQLAIARGIPECQFIRRINSEFSVPRTCVVGYNNIRFDDEVTRCGLYRNLLDPYAREWRYGNSRWDLIDVVRMARALRPEGIQWPRDEAGRLTLKLDHLTAINGIQHAHAHDALQDVMATISLAKLIKTRQPRLYDFLFQSRGKHAATRMLALGSMVPVVHASSRFSTEKLNLTLVVALAKSPANPNGIVTFDLSQDPQQMLEMTPLEIHDSLYAPRDQPGKQNDRVALKTIHLNKCPAIAPLSVIRSEDARRLALDVSLCMKHLDILKRAEGLGEKIGAVMSLGKREMLERDPELSLYAGFPTQSDRRTLDELASASPTELSRLTPVFDDPKYDELFFRYRARNFPETLDSQDRIRWHDHCQNRLIAGANGARHGLQQYLDVIAELEAGEASADRLGILNHLRGYAMSLTA